MLELDIRRRSLFIEDAAAVMGVSRRTIYYRIRQGRLETVRTIGGSQRVLLESIERLLMQERSERVRERFDGRADSITDPVADV